jgi:hypothetical protein
LRKYRAERVGVRIVVWDQDSGCVVQEVVEVEQVHGVLAKLGRERFQMLGNPYLYPPFVVIPTHSPHAETKVSGMRIP